MSYRRYFMWTLALPIALPIVISVIPGLFGVIFLMAFAIIPYAVCAIILTPLILLSNNLKQLIAISITAPVLMGICMYIFFLVIDPPELKAFPGRSLQLMSVIPPSMIVGYIYVALAWAGFSFGTKRGFINNKPPNKALKMDRANRTAH